MNSTSAFFNDWKRVRLLEQEQRVRSYSAFQQKVLKLVRFILHLVVGLSVLVTGLVTKASVLYVLNKLGGNSEKEEEDDKKAWMWMMVIIILAHYSVEFISCLFGVVFRQKSTPGLGQMLVVTTLFRLNLKLMAFV